MKRMACGWYTSARSAVCVRKRQKAFQVSVGKTLLRVDFVVVNLPMYIVISNAIFHYTNEISLVCNTL